MKSIELKREYSPKAFLILILVTFTMFIVGYFVGKGLYHFFN